MENVDAIDDDDDDDLIYEKPGENSWNISWPPEKDLKIVTPSVPTTTTCK